jgi:hypothetical protein
MVSLRKHVARYSRKRLPQRLRRELQQDHQDVVGPSQTQSGASQQVEHEDFDDHYMQSDDDEVFASTEPVLASALFPAENMTAEHVLEQQLEIIGIDVEELDLNDQSENAQASQQDIEYDDVKPSVQADEDYTVPVEPFLETNDDFSSAAIIETSSTTALTTAIGSTAGDEAIIDDDWENDNDEDTAEDVLFKRSWKLSKLGMALGLWVSSLFNIACLTHCKTLGHQHKDLSLRVDGASPDYQGFTRWPARVQKSPYKHNCAESVCSRATPAYKDAR